MRYTQGRATISKDSPRALGVCDRCRFRYNHNQLSWQYQWSGTRLQKLRILVCESCKDVPQQQLRSIIIPADPVPIMNPRPDGPFGYENLVSDLSAWTTQNATLTANAALAPDGTMTAFSLIENTNFSEHVCYKQIDLDPSLVGSVLTCSIFAKAAGRPELDLFVIENGFNGIYNNVYLALDAENPYGTTNYEYSDASPYVGRIVGYEGLTDKFYIQGSAFFLNQGAVGANVNFANIGDGWWWVGFSFKLFSEVLYLSSYLSNVFGLGYTYTGDGVSGVYLWKPQLVAGYSNVFPGTSYVRDD